MLLAALFTLAVVCAGSGALRILGVAKGARALGLAPAAGVAVLAVLSTWCSVLRLPPPLPGVAMGAVALGGATFALRDLQALRETVRGVWRDQRFAALVLSAAVVVPIVVMSFAFVGAEVPLSPHDGAAHTETMHADRFGQATLGWYPPALAALFGAWLDVFPWIDTAQGAFELGLSLPLLASLSVFGVGVAVWRDMRAAALAALLLGFTYIYPYFPQLWSGWPLALSIVLVIGMWTIAIEYLEAPSMHWALLGGVMLGAVLVVHGTELYTLAILLPIVLLSNGRVPRWDRLVTHIGIAGAIALACAAVYVPVLFDWAGAGGAYAVGIEDATPQAAAVAQTSGPDPFVASALGSLGIDLPVRGVLLAIGVGCAFLRRRGRAVVVVGLVFASVTSGFLLLSGQVALVRQLYAAIFPWGMHYRVFIMVALAQVLLAGAGGVAAMDWIRHWTRWPGRQTRLMRRAARLLFLTWLGLMTWAAIVFLAYPTGLVLGYGPDDKLAMAWLRGHAPAGAVVLNDGYADGGIWTVYKAGLPVLLPRAAPFSAEDWTRRRLVLDNVAHLDAVPEAAAAACAYGVRYVYYGSRVSEWDARSFPPLDELRASSALREVFASGDAVVFETNFTCASPR